MKKKLNSLLKNFVKNIWELLPILQNPKKITRCLNLSLFSIKIKTNNQFYATNLLINQISISQMHSQNSKLNSKLKKNNINIPP